VTGNGKAARCGFPTWISVKATLIDSPNRGAIFLRSHFVLLARGKSLDIPEVQKIGYPLRLNHQVPESRIWTDD
jgi:hypothetical protein